MTVDTILLLYTLTGLQCTLDCKTRELWTGSEEPGASSLPMPRRTAQLVTTEGVVLRPRAEQIITLLLESPGMKDWPAEGVVDPVQEGMTVTTRVWRVEAGCVLTSLANFTDDEQNTWSQDPRSRGDTTWEIS